MLPMIIAGDASLDAVIIAVAGAAAIASFMRAKPFSRWSCFRVITAADGRSRAMFARNSVGLSYSAITRPHPLLERAFANSFEDSESLPNVMKVSPCMICFARLFLDIGGNETGALTGKCCSIRGHR